MDKTGLKITKARINEGTDVNFAANTAEGSLREAELRTDFVKPFSPEVYTKKTQNITQ